MGYSGAINTPTADVLPWGSASLGLSNSIPEHGRTLDSGSFGSLNAGFGLLPGLELVGRLSFEGDLHCNLYLPDCQGRSRDLSVSGKYQLPIELPLNTRLALGFTDYGGAATNYRQFYGVATSSVGPLDLSLGYSKPKSSAALLDGAFGSVALRIDERWAIALENDTRANRLGAHYSQPLSRDVALQLGLSRKLGEGGAQQPWQATVALNMQLGRNPGGQSPSVSGARANVPTADWVSPVQADSVAPPLESPPALTAEALAQALQARGFAQIEVEHWPAAEGQPALWRVRAEPRRWRQSQLDGLAAALAPWLKAQGAQAEDELLLALTYQRQPVLHAYTSARCLAGWERGWTRCDPLSSQAETAYGLMGEALRLSRTGDWPQPLAEHLARRTAATAAEQARADGGPAWLPQFEISPGLRNTVGTEYGLMDYSLALELGAEVNLAPGLFLQGVASTPVANSTDYDDRHVFAAGRHPTSGLDSGYLAYWRPLPWGFSAQAAAGQLSRHEKGAQADAMWMSEDGRWRLAGVAARYTSDLERRVREPRLASLRYSPIPGAWQLEGMAGRFLGGDEGYKVMSSHWLGDTRFSLYYRRSASPQKILMPERQFLGFEVSMPLGPKAAQDIGPVTVRGRDRWGWGLETKVGESDNYLTGGYGLIPRLRHGLTSDVSDHDRNGSDELLANGTRLRARLSEQLRVTP